MRLCFSLLFCGLLGAFAARAADPLVTDMVEKIIKAAQTRYVNGQVPEAIAAMVRAVELDPNFPRSFFVRARFYEESGQYSKAVEDFSRVLKLDPKSILALEQRGICNFFAGNFKDSVSDFDQVIKLDPSKGPYHWQRGISLYYAKDYAAGVRQFESHHDHAGHPEEQNVITGFQHSGRIESSCSLEVLPKSICHFS